MSDRGSILISTANDIGEALVEKLGGEGYAPAVWDKEYNKLGIAEVDSAPALSVLEDSSETGTARGSILLSTANAIGAMLNKKYNTDRGFKPKEWASAGRKMKALETDTKSGSIVNIQGAKETPLLSLVGTIDPTIEGTSEVNAYKLGKNLVSSDDIEQGSISSATGGDINSQTRVRIKYLKVNPSTDYAFSMGGTATIYELYQYDKNRAKLTYSTINAQTTVLTTRSDCAYVRFIMRYSNNASITPSDIVNLQIEQNSEVTTYEQYHATTYTADLGETVYCGNVDFIHGKILNNGKKIKLNSLTWVYNDTSYSYGFFDAQYNITDMTDTMTFVCTGYVNNKNARNALADGEIGVYNKASSIKRLVIRDDSCTTIEQFLQKIADYYLSYQSTDETESSIAPIDISTSGDVENYYTSAGDTSIEYYEIPTPYTRGTASGAIANVQSARTDLPFTQVKANIAPNLTGVSEVKVFNTGAGLVTVPDVSGSINNAYFYNISTGFTLTAGVTYKITMVVNSTVTPFAVSVGVGDDSAYRYDIYNTGIINKNGVVSFEFTPEASHLTTWDKLWIRAPRYSDPSGSQQTTCTFTVTNILLYTSEPTVYTADLGEPVYGGYADLVSGTGKSTRIKKTVRWGDLGNVTQLADVTRKEIVLSASEEPKYTASSASTDLQNDKDLPYDQTYSGNYEHIYIANTSRIWIYLPNGTDADTEIAISYTLADALQTDLTFDGQVVRVSPGVNNLWNNAGGDTDVEYFTQE